jgi:putative inorganic carbon (HCO3(-)) transporter
VAGLITRRPAAAVPSRAAELWWVVAAALIGAVVVGGLLIYSVQATCAFVLVVLVIALHQHDRRWGIAAMFALWFAAPFLRRIFLLMTGPVGNDPLSLAPFMATGAIAALELVQFHMPTRVRRILLVAGAGFAFGLPIGFLFGPRAAVYAVVAYLAALSAAVLGFNERSSLRDSTLRRALLFGMPPIAAYAIAQRFLPLPTWDQAWLDVTNMASIGAGPDDRLRVFGSLNSPGTLAPLLALSLLCCLTIIHHRMVAAAGAMLLVVALSLTNVRSAWVALIAAGLAHVIASRGRSARLVFGAGAVVVAATLALAPVSTTARDVLNRFNTIGDLGGDRSAQDRDTTFSVLLPRAVAEPAGHGLGSAGEPSKLGGVSELRTPDNGYLALVYQVGPIGFLCVMAAIALITKAAWDGARARAPGQELRLLLFAMLVFLLVQLAAGDIFYGVNGVILWFIGGQVLAFEARRRYLERRSAANGSLIASR